MPDPDPIKTYSLPEAATRLNVHVNSVRRWAQEGKLPTVKLGNRLRIREIDLITFLEATEEVSEKE